MSKPNTQLKDHRSSIDLLDQSIVSLIAKRMKIVKKVGQYKRNKGIQPLDQTRWQQVLDSKKSLAIKEDLNPKLIIDIYNLMHQEALKIEREI